MDDNKCYFHTGRLYNTYIYKPLICKFDHMCNGICHKRGLQVNHSYQKYCFVINCTSITCTKNHLLNWRAIHHSINIDLIDLDQYAGQIHYGYGGSHIREIISDNLCLDPKSVDYDLMKALEREIELNEKCAFMKADDRYQQEQARKLLEIENKNRKLRIEKMYEKILLGKKMVKVYINIRNSGDVEAEYKQIIKQKFYDLKKDMLFNIIEQFLGNDEQFCKDDDRY